MSGIAHIGSMSTGHESFQSRPIISGSNNVFVNGIGTSRIGDAWQQHCDDNSCHNCNQATGSSSVYVNGIPLARVSDATGCGDMILNGSLDTFCG